MMQESNSGPHRYERRIKWLHFEYMLSVGLVGYSPIKDKGFTMVFTIVK